MNSLKVKILGLITAIALLIIAASAYINVQQQKHLTTDIIERDAQVLTETIRTAIADVMRSGHHADVRSIFSRIRSENHIRSLRIVNQEGVVLNSAVAGEIGAITPSRELKEIRSGNHERVHNMAGTRVYHSLTPIYNGPHCSGCHDPARKVLGVLELEMSLDYVNDFFQEGRRFILVTTSVLVLLLVACVFLFLHIYVDKPVRQMVRAMTQVEEGNLHEQPVITSSQEMNLLTTHFNRMIERLKSLVETTVENEVQLAKAEDKLAHHYEIHQMNHKLAEQIKEIENLNIILEERIEEIEGANYKIADLAGELEDKNYNLEKAVAKLSTLYKVGLGINSIIELDKLFNLIVRTTMETLQAQIGYIVLYTPKQGVLRIKALHGLNDVSPDAHLLPMQPSGVATWVINNRKPLLITDMKDAPGFDRFSVLGYERKTLVAAPLIAKDGIIGTITVVNKVDNSIYNNEDLELLTTIAAQASIAITNAKLYDEQQRTYMNTIHALVSAIEANDSYTRGHSERVTRYSLKLAAKLGLSEERMKIIERAAILHDIGKIGINLALLNKQGLLTPEEVRELQQHPDIGMKILEPIEFLHDVRLCIGQHHERFDGHGYPHSLKGDQLLLESRILAIADAFDAMTSDRPYRKALSIETAVEELKKNSGGQFDPDLVRHFIQTIGCDSMLAGSPGDSAFISTSAA
ncbi:HD domain-containing phosphohydrolase [Geobacter sp. DSM 9736]|uniref:HD domain-containing phosphohydrolase n=1 Tax=Geobacter sp. DSM 9736 TaxID=1277350 RepID=UPI000B50B6F2|nr:HD domain-containing phosphohydrolase [Geobacter sp. DSM 9736]SNB44836.1 HDIG domain-containing protein [Geobacter sp. DSM 9736]